MRTLTDDWHLVPLLGGDFRLQQAEVDPARVVWHHDRYCLLVHGQGDHHFKRQSALATASEWTTLRRLRLLPGLSARSSLRVVGALDGTAIRVWGSAAVTEADGSKLYYLPADANELVLALEPDVPVLPPDPVPGSWIPRSWWKCGKGDCCIVSEPGPGRTGSGLSMDLVLPANVIAPEASGEDLIECRVGPAEVGRRTLHIAWKTGISFTALSCLWPMACLDAPRDQLVVPCAPTHREPPDRAAYVILPVDGIGSTGQNLRDARHSFRLPTWIQEQVQAGDYLTAESGAELQLQAEWPPRLPPPRPWSARRSSNRVLWWTVGCW